MAMVGCSNLDVSRVHQLELRFQGTLPKALLYKTTSLAEQPILATAGLFHLHAIHVVHMVQALVLYEFGFLFFLRFLLSLSSSL